MNSSSYMGVSLCTKIRHRGNRRERNHQTQTRDLQEALQLGKSNKFKINTFSNYEHHNYCYCYHYYCNKQYPTTTASKSCYTIQIVFTILLISVAVISCVQADSPSLQGQPGLGPATSSANSRGAHGHNIYQPALIGFRCDIQNDLTPSGVSVIESKTPVTLTLYGESFSTRTIVAFTPEFRPDPELDPGQSTHVVDETHPARQPHGSHQHKSNGSDTEASSSSTALSVGVTGDTDEGASDAPVPRERRFSHRRRTWSKSYDCTDYNRVTSYKLTEANILSPNVAVLTITLPELDASSGMYYYFCLKQPRLTASPDGSDSSRLSSNEIGAGWSSSSAKEGESNITDHSKETLVWVHQGTEWWVTLKVEPPVLSVANDIVLIFLLLCLSAVASGLNLGLMALDMNELAVISSCGSPQERAYARTIAPIRRRGNYLLCSLLLSNVMVNSTLTVILEQLTNGPVAVIGSTLAIVLLGEIVPQAICARQGLAIGARTVWLTYAFMLITSPLSYPISWLLDYVLGEEKGNVYDRERLMEFIKITGHHTQLDADEVAIISGALKLKKIKVDQIMTRIEDVFMLPIDCQLDRETIRRIIEKGYSRIPVYEFGDRKQIAALILAKDLALLDPDDHTPIANILMYCKHPLIFIEDDATLDVALNEFKTGKSHMAVVRQIYDDGETDKYYEAIGVVTLEDVIEEVLQVEINDETDTLSDNRRKRRRTEAQVSHLLDEFTCRSMSPASVATTLGASHHNQQQQQQHHHLQQVGRGQQQVGGSEALCALPAPKQDDACLSSRLTSISIEGVAQSLAQTGPASLTFGVPAPGAGNTGGSGGSPRTASYQSTNEQLSGAQQEEPAAQEQLHGSERLQPQQQQQEGQAQNQVGADGGVINRAAHFLASIMR